MNQTVEVLVGAVLPTLIDLLNRKVKNSKVKYAISLVVCLLVGVLFNLKALDVADVLGSGAIVFVSAQTVYKTYWDKSKARKSFDKSITNGVNKLASLIPAKKK